MVRRSLNIFYDMNVRMYIIVIYFTIKNTVSKIIVMIILLLILNYYYRYNLSCIENAIIINNW